MVLDQGFETLYFLRCMVSVELIIVNLITVKIALKISPIRMVQNIASEIFAALIMAVVALGLKQLGDNLIWEFISIFICAMCLFCCYFIAAKH